MMNLKFLKTATEEEKKYHETIFKITNDIEKYHLIRISSFMIITNKLIKINCNKREILEPLLIILSPCTIYLSRNLSKFILKKYH